MPKRARIEVRTDPEHEALLRRAAGQTKQTLTAFILGAAQREAEAVLGEASTTVVPSELFDELGDALDRPAVPNANLRKAAERLDGLIERR